MRIIKNGHSHCEAVICYNAPAKQLFFYKRQQRITLIDITLPIKLSHTIVFTDSLQNIITRFTHKIKTCVEILLFFVYYLFFCRIFTNKNNTVQTYQHRKYGSAHSRTRITVMPGRHPIR